MESAKILVTGATGATGGSAITKLLEFKIPVRALVHKKDARSEQLRALGVEIVQGDLSDFEAVSEALKGITGAYFVYPVQVPGILEATAFFAQAAIEQGVSAIVNMSQISARRTAKSHASQNHWIAERLLDRSGIPVTHLRPTFFAEWVMYLSRAIRDKNILPLAFGDARYAPILGEDLGRVIAAILKNPVEHSGKIYPLYGSKELSQYEVVGMLTQVLGKNITYVSMEIVAFQEMLKEWDLPPTSSSIWGTLPRIAAMESFRERMIWWNNSADRSHSGRWITSSRTRRYSAKARPLADKLISRREILRHRANRVSKMKRKVLITGATGDTGRAAVKESIQRGLAVRAMVHHKDDRSAALGKLGAEVVVGDLQKIDEIRHAMEGTDAAYLVYPIQPGLIDATVYFAQAAKEAGVSAIVNLSQRSASRTSSSHSCRDTWIAEQVLN